MCNVALLDVKDPIALDYLRKLDTTAERLNTILTRLLIINQIQQLEAQRKPDRLRRRGERCADAGAQEGPSAKLRISKRIDDLGRHPLRQGARAHRAGKPDRQRHQIL